jgi:hypothetical protein
MPPGIIVVENLYFVAKCRPYIILSAKLHHNRLLFNTINSFLQHKKFDLGCLASSSAQYPMDSLCPLKVALLFKHTFMQVTALSLKVTATFKLLL